MIGSTPSFQAIPVFPSRTAVLRDPLSQARDGAAGRAKVLSSPEACAPCAPPPCPPVKEGGEAPPLRTRGACAVGSLALFPPPVLPSGVFRHLSIRFGQNARSSPGADALGEEPRSGGGGVWRRCASCKRPLRLARARHLPRSGGGSPVTPSWGHDIKIQNSPGAGSRARCGPSCGERRGRRSGRSRSAPSFQAITVFPSRNAQDGGAVKDRASSARPPLRCRRRP
jgi:hypothetical protein